MVVQTRQLKPHDRYGRYSLQSTNDALTYLLTRLPLERSPATAEDLFAQLDTLRSGAQEPPAPALSGSDVAMLVHKDKLLRTYIACLETAPAEDEYGYGCVRFLAELVERFPDADEWIAATYWRNLYARPATAAGLLRGLGRLSCAAIEPWGPSLAEHGLAHDDVEVRDAAVGAFESWGHPRAIELLSAAAVKEPEPWLARYMKQVVSDLATPVG